MICRHFGECGSCSIFDKSYEEQLQDKSTRLKEMLSPFYTKEIETFSSAPERFRGRAEYKIYHDDDRCGYAMRRLDGRGFVTIRECPMVSEAIDRRMWRLMEIVNGDELLKKRLFGVEFLSTTTGELLATMLYHRRLDEAWESRAKELERALDLKIIGRSRKQKIVLSEEFVTETLHVEGRAYRYRHYEQSFTQPNPGVNEKMIGWAMKMAHRYGAGDFCELYAGAGNFTIPLSRLFERVIATEISKRSIYAAKQNCELNGIENITFLRMSSEEFTEALQGKRDFRRLAGVDLKSYDIGTVLVDPPRAGLDEDTAALIGRFDTIIYISCNPVTLARDLHRLTKSHKVENAALFDQFPYTPHMEAGVLLRRSVQEKGASRQ